LNFTRAALKLRVAQPALSRQIRQLEEEVGVPLFTRDRHGTRMTEAGRAFLAEAKALLERSEHAIQAAQQAERKFEQPYRVGYVWGLFHTLAPPILERLRLRFPHCPMHLLDLTPAQQAQDLCDGRLDAGFIGFAHEADSAGLPKRMFGLP
jgi:DNA-binding transcriptional LysR family regulator